MKRLFWLFTIRKRIRKILTITVEEQAVFENERLKILTEGRSGADYISSMIATKAEVAEILRSLL